MNADDERRRSTITPFFTIHIFKIEPLINNLEEQHLNITNTVTIANKLNGPGSQATFVDDFRADRNAIIDLFQNQGIQKRAALKC